MQSTSTGARAAAGLSVCFLLSSCSSSSDAPLAELTAGEALTQAISFGAAAVVVKGKLPKGSALDVGLATDEATPVPDLSPDQRVDLSIPWQGGAISAVNISFGGSSYFRAKVSSKAATGSFSLSGTVSADVCSQLASTCHMIACYEQVVLPDGKTVSKAAAMQLVLDCTDGAGCGTSNSSGGAVVAPKDGSVSATGTSMDAGGNATFVPERDSGSLPVVGFDFDGGPRDGGVPDASTASDAARSPDSTVTCGAKNCTAFSTPLATLPPGCALDWRDAEVCGIATWNLLGDGGEPPYLEKYAPGVISSSCGAFLDVFDSLPDGGRAEADAATKGNGKLDQIVTVSGLQLVTATPGCCTAAGICGGDTGKVETRIGSGVAMEANEGFGCLESRYMFARSTVPEPERTQRIPCDPTSGMRTDADAGQ